jgi:cytochrome d ubiquinol oxidase subunit II
MDYNLTWFFLIGVLLAGYAVLDGFDLGAGILSLFTKKEKERRIVMNSIAPVWDGNEVWLLTGGGAMFAAFPPVYATVFSGFYLAFMLLLFALIMRAVSFEFFSHSESPVWKNVWYRAFGVGSLLPAILYGAAVGNILRGLPVTAEGTLNISFLGLLNPYALLVAVLGLFMFIVQGSLYVAVKTEGELQDRAARFASGAWIVYVVLYIAATIATYFVSPFLFAGLLGNPLFWLFFLLLLAGIVYNPIAQRAAKYTHAFLASSVTIIAMIGLTGISLFPRMVPSSIDLAYSLTVYNASSTQRTLETMFVIALIGVPIMLTYTTLVYRAFRGKVVLTDDSY